MGLFNTSVHGGRIAQWPGSCGTRFASGSGQPRPAGPPCGRHRPGTSGCLTTDPCTRQRSGTGTHALRPAGSPRYRHPARPRGCGDRASRAACALLVQPHPGPPPLDVDIFDAYLGRHADPREGVDHQADERAITQTDRGAGGRPGRNGRSASAIRPTRSARPSSGHASRRSVKKSRWSFTGLTGASATATATAVIPTRRKTRSTKP